MISYAAYSWAHHADTIKIRKKLLKLDRLALLSISMTAPSVPTRGLAVMYDILPLELFLKRTAIMNYLRLPSNYGLSWDGMSKSKRLAKSHRLFWKDELEKICPNLSEDSDRTDVLSDLRRFRVVCDLSLIHI